MDITSNPWRSSLVNDGQWRAPGALLLLSPPAGPNWGGCAAKIDSRLGSEYGEAHPDGIRLCIDRRQDQGTWRLAREDAKVRGIIHAADLEIVEEWKWVKATNPGALQPCDLRFFGKSIPGSCK